MNIKQGYKQTEIGIIPEDWEVETLRNIAYFTNGKAHEQFINETGNYIVINSKFVSTEGKVFKKSVSALALLETGNIAMVMSDIPNGKALAKCFFVDENNKYTLNQRICSIKSSICNNIFLFWKLNRNKYFLAFDSGSGQTNLKKKEVLDCPIAIPPTIEEQTAIATALSDIDALIGEVDKLIAKKQGIKQATMQQLLTGKKRLSGFSGEWEVKRLGEVFGITAGGDLDKSNFSTTKDEKYSFPVYSNSLSDKGLYGYSPTYSQEENTITVTARGTVGFANARNHKYSAIGRVLVLSPLEKVSCFFVAEYINNKVSFANESTGVPQLTAPQISKYDIILPTYQEQTAIANILSDMDAEISQLEGRRAKMGELKQGMMQELLTGRIRLTGVSY